MGSFFSGFVANGSLGRLGRHDVGELAGAVGGPQHGFEQRGVLHLAAGAVDEREALFAVVGTAVIPIYGQDAAVDGRLGHVLNVVAAVIFEADLIGGAVL